MSCMWGNAPDSLLNNVEWLGFMSSACCHHYIKMAESDFLMDVQWELCGCHNYRVVTRKFEELDSVMSSIIIVVSETNFPWDNHRLKHLVAPDRFTPWSQPGPLKPADSNHWTSVRNHLLPSWKHPVTELMNIPDTTFVKSTQFSATTEQTWHH